MVERKSVTCTKGDCPPLTHGCIVGPTIRGSNKTGFECTDFFILEDVLSPTPTQSGHFSIDGDFWISTFGLKYGGTILSLRTKRLFPISQPRGVNLKTIPLWPKIDSLAGYVG